MHRTEEHFTMKISQQTVPASSNIIVVHVTQRKYALSFAASSISYTDM